MLGRTVKTERPGYLATETTENSYNGAGQLTKTTASGQPDTLYEYDELGNQTRSGLDINANSALNLASTDRITESETSYESESSDWFLQTVSKVYCTDNSSTPTTNSVSRQKLTGLTGGTRSIVSTLDYLGNETITTTTVDRDNKTVTQTNDVPDSASNIVAIAVNGLLQEQTSQTGVRTTFTYDTLGRQTRSETSGGTRSVASVTHYNSLGQVDYVEDAASNRTCYGYESTTGRRISQTDAMSNTSYSSYNSYGQVEKTWGSATYPVSYSYDSYGRMATMNTYRGGEGWDGTNWPGAPGAADTTTWAYHEGSGLLTSKQDAAGKSVTYTYLTGGKLDTRTWARADGTNSLVTTYSYNTAGDMTGLDYSDSTPDVAFTVDRMGRQLTASSSVSSHEFAYTGLLLDTETITINHEPSTITNIIDRSNDSLGRPTGFTLGSDYSATYQYDSLGRVSIVSNYALYAFSAVNYSYLPSSDLISGYTESLSGLSVAKGYEDHRNLLTAVSNSVGATSVSRFDYQNDSAGRRTQRVDLSGVTNTFGYNTRSEVTSALMSTNVYGYLYDPIGNRIWAVANTESNDYTANELNQYTQITNGGVMALAYDLDGNLTNNSTLSFSWDGENRLMSVSNSSVVFQCSYDYQSRRSQKVVNGVTNTFIYDGWNLIQEISSTGVTNTYSWGIDLSGSLQGAGGIGGLLAVIHSDTNSPQPTVYYPTFDANGNITDYVTTNGTVVAHREYDAFGNTIVATGSMVNDFNFWFSTKYLDQETGLYYYGYRYYSPSLGRWLSRDPIGEKMGMNIQEFTINNPLFYVDTDGRIVWPSPGGVNDPAGGKNYPTIPGGVEYIPDPRPNPVVPSDSDLAVHGDWHGKIHVSIGTQLGNQQDAIDVWYEWPRVPYTCPICTKAHVHRKFHGINDPFWNGAGQDTALPGDIHATPDQPGDSILGNIPSSRPYTLTFTYELECIEAPLPIFLKVLSTDTRTFLINGRRVIEVKP